MTSINFWDAQADPNDDAGQSSGIADPDYNPTQQDDDTAIIIVIVVASIVFVCGAGVVIHHFRKKHKVVYAETSMDDAIAVPVSEGAGPVEEVGGGGLRVFKAKQVRQKIISYLKLFCNFIWFKIDFTLIYNLKIIIINLIKWF